MSGRTKKITTTTTLVSKVSTPVSNFGAGSSTLRSNTPGSANRPASPTMISRLHEKNELASLNDRLAMYIERVRQLESENGKLTRIVQTHEETVTKESSKIKGLFENELASARNLLDAISKEKAQLQMENEGLKKSREEIHDKLEVRETELAMIKSRLMSAESQVTEQQVRLSDSLNQRRYWEDEYNKLKKEMDTMAKSLAVLKKKLDEETIAKVDLENRIQSLREEAAFKCQLHEQEIKELFSKNRVVTEEVDIQLQDDYDNRLMEALQQIRVENEEQIRMMRLETEEIFERKYMEMREAASRNEGVSEKSISEMRILKKRVEEQVGEINKLQNLLRSSEGRLHDLENQLKLEKEDHEANVHVLNAQIRTLKNTIDEQMLEYRDLMDVKIQLDTEIAAYRNLLESEESRLKMSQSHGGNSSQRHSNTPVDQSRKRKRMDLETSGVSSYSNNSYVAGGAASILGKSGLIGAGAAKVSSSSSQAGFQCSSSSKDAIYLAEVCPEGKYIKLTNTSTEKDFTLGGCQLKHLSGDVETLYKFHRTLHVKPEQSVTVWSATTETTHSPPNDLVMKGQSWHIGDQNKTLLLDPKGDEIASLEMHTSSKFISEDGDGINLSQSSNKGSVKGWLSFLSMLG